MIHIHKTVVLADDERIITTVIGERLHEMGLCVRHARDGLLALQLVEQTHPDLVIVDVGMPKQDGLQVCSAIKSRADLADIPVVILTGRSDARTMRRIMELGVTYVSKSPNMWNRLSDAVTRILEQRIVPA